MSRGRAGEVLFGVVVWCFSFLQTTNAQIGFISIDCGTGSNYTDNRKIFWVNDERYTVTGQNGIVDISGANLNTNQVNDIGPQLQTIRYFPGTQSKSCYMIPEVEANQLYLVRLMFLAGDLTSKLGKSITFGVTLGNYRWEDVVIDDPLTPVIMEAVLTTMMSPWPICFLRDVGTPFISSIEIRILPRFYYQTSLLQLHVLTGVYRIDCGLKSGSANLRYPSDTFDRFWTPDPANVSFPVITTATQSFYLRNDYSVSLPNDALRSAWVAPSLNSSISFSWPIPPSGKMYYVGFFFVELQQVKPTDIREVDIYLSGVYQETATINSSVLSTYDITIPAYTSLNVTLVRNPRSTLPVMLNAVESYMFDSYNYSFVTHPDDAAAIASFITSANLTTWSGDPCLPVPYSWLKCSSPQVSNISRVLQINLLNQNITGFITKDIAKLIELTDLALDNNNITGTIPDLSALINLQTIRFQNNQLQGSIPDSLALLPNLTLLTLDHNLLEGGLPPGLAKKIDMGSLTFSASDNPYLCFGGNPCLRSTNSSSTSFPRTPSKSSSSNIGPEVGAAIGAVLGLLLLVMILVCVYRKRTNSKLPGESNVNVVAHGVSSFSNQPRDPNQPIPFSRIEVLQATNNFSRKIGKGGYGDVYYGQLPDGQEVAVKVNKGNSHQGAKEFLNEVTLLSRLHHKNLVSFVGYCKEENERVLIYAFMSQGTLQEHLYGEGGAPVQQPLDWRTRLDIVLNAARGIEYLHHSCSPPVIHRDIKPSNILLTDRLTAKISDFGISKSIIQNNQFGIMTGVKGSFGYLDPEYSKENRLNLKSDIYSFGVVLLEVITGRKYNTTQFPNGVTSTLIDWVGDCLRGNSIQEIVDPTLTTNYNLDSAWRLVELAMACLEPHAVNRPDIQEVVIALSEALDLEEHQQGIITPSNHSPSDLVASSFDQYQRVYPGSRSSARSSNESFPTMTLSTNVTAR